jgi:DNA adenine methylase
MTIMRRPFPYMGSKWRAMTALLPILPAHISSIEPFTGSGAFTLSKPAVTNEMINDMNGVLVNVWRVFKYHGEELARRIDLTPHARAVFQDALALLSMPTLADRLNAAKETGGDIEVAEAYLVWAWQCIYPRKGATGWYVTDNDRKRRGDYYALDDRIRMCQERLRRVTIEQTDAFVLIERYKDDPSCFLFLDPPYLAEVCGDEKRHYEAGFTQDDHVRLLTLIQDAQARIMLSSYPNDLYQQTLTGWNTFDVETNTMSNMTLKQGFKRVERFWWNGDVHPVVQKELFDDTQPQ